MNEEKAVRVGGIESELESNNRQKKITASLQTTVNITEIPRDNLQKEMKSTKYGSAPVLLGRGGFGTVYKGTYNYTIPVAIKELQMTNEFSKDQLIEFQQEMTIMAKLRSPYVVTLYGICTQDYIPSKQPYTLVMEYVELGSLKGVLTKNNEQYTDWLYPLEWSKERRQLMLDISYGLAYLHDNNIIHRDLKSDNILITYNFHAKLADFGISKEKLSDTYTDRSALLGTRGYIAPELLKDPTTPTSSRTDMYSYGVILNEIASRAVPAFNANEYQIIMGTRPIPPNDCPPLVKNLIQCSWDTDPQKRPSAHEAAKLLSTPNIWDKELIENEKNSNNNNALLKDYEIAPENNNNNQSVIRSLEITELENVDTQKVAPPQLQNKLTLTKASFFVPPPKKKLTSGEQQRQNEFIEMILKGDLEKVKTLHEKGASLTEANKNNLYPFVAAVYSGNPSLLVYIEEQLGSKANNYWAQVDKKMIIESFNKVIPRERPEDIQPNFTWLAKWFTAYKDQWWCANYDAVMLQKENANATTFQEENTLKWGLSWENRWTYGYKQEPGINWLQRGIGVLSNSWTERLIGSKKKAFLYAPSPKNHDAYVKQLVETLNNHKKYCLTKVEKVEETLEENFGGENKLGN